ncbi:MAG: hypothetical protein ACLFRL_03740 [Desulfohalobiaceae bacterium]
MLRKQKDTVRNGQNILGLSPFDQGQEKGYGDPQSIKPHKKGGARCRRQ